MDYLVTHQYIDPQTAGLKRKDLHLTESVQESTLRNYAANHAGLSNVVSYNCIGASEVVFDEQYTAFKQFLRTDCLEKYRKELEGLLYPLFCHVYLDMIISGHKTPAHRFMSKHQGLFQGRPEETSMVETLQVVSNVEDFLQESVRTLRESKYGVTLTSGAFEAVTSYLKSRDHTGLLYLLERFVDVRIVASENGVDGAFCDLGMKEQTRNIEDIANESEDLIGSKSIDDGDFSNGYSSPSVAELKDIIEKVRDLPPTPPSVLVYQATQGKVNLPDITTAELSLSTQVLALGCEDSAIRIFPTSAASKARLSARNLNGPEELISEPTPNPTGEHTFRGHSGSVSAISFFPDPDYFVSSSADKTLRLWRVDQRDNIAVYKGHNYQVLTVTTSPNVDSGYFVSGSFDRTSRLWTTDRTFPLRTLVGHNLAVESVCFHPNQTYFATGSADKTVRLWTISDGKFVRLFQGHRAGIYALAFSPDGRYLASAGEDRRVRVWDIAQGTSLKEFKGHVDVVNSICFSSDNSMLASGSQDGSIRIWDVAKGLSSNASGDHPSDVLIHHPRATSATTSSTAPSVVHKLAFSECNTLHAVVATLGSSKSTTVQKT